MAYTLATVDAMDATEAFLDSVIIKSGARVTRALSWQQWQTIFRGQLNTHIFIQVQYLDKNNEVQRQYGRIEDQFVMRECSTKNITSYSNLDDICAVLFSDIEQRLDSGKLFIIGWCTPKQRQNDQLIVYPETIILRS